MEHLASLDDFRAACALHRAVLIDAFADWCGPCKQMSPLFESVAMAASSRGVGCYKMDVDAAQDLAAYLDVCSLPTFLLVVDGEVVGTVVGADRAGLTALALQASRIAAALPMSYSSG